MQTIKAVLGARVHQMFIMKTRLLLCNSLVFSGDKIIYKNIAIQTVFCVPIKFDFLIGNKKLTISFGTVQLVQKAQIIRFLKLVGFSTIDSFLVYGLTNFTYIGSSVTKTYTLISFIGMPELLVLLAI